MKGAIKRRSFKAEESSQLYEKNPPN